MLISVIILAVLQGLGEFLPISSSGHLVLLNKLFNVNDFLLLSVILHVATLFSVVFVLKKEILIILKNPFCSVTKKLIIATIPTIVIVLIFKKFFSNAYNGDYLPLCFMATAFVIVISEFLNKRNKQKVYSSNKIGKNNFCKQNDCAEFSNIISYKTCIFMGIMQGVAVLPGVSRSGFTICAGLSMGKDRKSVAKFSFLMSIPIILASLVFEVYEYINKGITLSLMWYEVLIGFLIAIIVGVFSAKFMLKIVSKYSLLPFAVYLVGISILSFFSCF